jgi:hypothetical protein
MKGNSAVPGGPLDEYAGVAEYLRVFGHAGFFFLVMARGQPHA